LEFDGTAGRWYSKNAVHQTSIGYPIPYYTISSYIGRCCSIRFCSISIVPFVWCWILWKLCVVFFYWRKMGALANKTQSDATERKWKISSFFFSSPCLSQKEKEITGGQIWWMISWFKRLIPSHDEAIYIHSILYASCIQSNVKFYTIYYILVLFYTVCVILCYKSPMVVEEDLFLFYFFFGGKFKKKRKKEKKKMNRRGQRIWSR
jgi:hypothetical protein